MGDNFNGLPVTLTFDDTPFITNFFGQNIAGGSALGPLSMFTVTIEPEAAPGTYNGVFSVLFDSDNGSSQDSNPQTFSVTVLAVPEPQTMTLLLLGAAGIVSMKFAKKRS